MPPSHVLARSPDVFTTTVFAGGPPTTVPNSSSSHAHIPIGAIVGGLLGGVVLALAAVGGWIWWGRSIEKQSRKKKPHLRSAMKHNRQGPPSANASKQSVVPSHPTKNPMATVSQKSVTFAPSPRTSEDSDPPKTPSPTVSEPEPRGDDKDKGKQTPRTANGAVRSPPPRSKLRPPPGSKRTRSADRAYAPSRPSPLAHASHPAPPTAYFMRPGNQIDSHPPPAMRQLTNTSADRSSAVSAPSEYSQEGTASEGGSEAAALRIAHALDGRLYSHQEVEEWQPSARGPPNYNARIR